MPFFPGTIVYFVLLCEWVALKRAVSKDMFYLSAKFVKGASLSFQGIDDVQSGDSFPLGMLGVGDRVTDNVLEKDLKNAAGLFVN